MENIFAIFPHNGKTFAVFSTQWKKFSGFFHTMEKIALPGFTGDFSLGFCGIQIQAAEVEEQIHLEPMSVAEESAVPAAGAARKLRPASGLAGPAGLQVSLPGVRAVLPPALSGAVELPAGHGAVQRRGLPGPPRRRLPEPAGPADADGDRDLGAVVPPLPGTEDDRTD